MKLRVQEFLEANAFADLARIHGVYATFSKDRRKVSLNYDQIEAKESDKIACECRGLILRRPDGEPFPDTDEHVGPTVVVALPFSRFFNHGQNSVDASLLLGVRGTRVYEKLDGTLCIVYYDELKGEWHVATRRVPEGDMFIDGFGTFTFRTLFEHALKEQLNLSFDRFTSTLYKDRTYLFELTGPYNRVVVEYDRPRIHLLAVKYTDTDVELCVVEHAHILFREQLGIPRAPYKDVGTLGELLGLVSAHSPTESEGVVVCGPLFERIKVKNPAYVALNALKSSVANSPRRLLEVILLEKDDDVFPLLPPEVQKIGQEYKAKLNEFSLLVDGFLYPEFYERSKRAENPRKEFALLVQKVKGPMPYFIGRFTGKFDHVKGYVYTNKDLTGGWKDSFLDGLLHAITHIQYPDASTLYENVDRSA